MATQREINSIEELRSALVDAGVIRTTDGYIEFKHQGIDSRNGWDTYLVVANGCAVGMSDGLLKENTNHE